MSTAFIVSWDAVLVYDHLNWTCSIGDRGTAILTERRKRVFSEY